jgi:hypothetical protein
MILFLSKEDDMNLKVVLELQKEGVFAVYAPSFPASCQKERLNRRRCKISVKLSSFILNPLTTILPEWAKR